MRKPICSLTAICAWGLALVLFAGCNTNHRIKLDFSDGVKSLLHMQPPGLVQKPVENFSGDCCLPKVAILDLDGEFTNRTQASLFGQISSTVESLRERLLAIKADPQIVAIVLRVNSPGGSAAATEVMYQELERFRAETNLPMVACLMETAAGSGYHLATVADEIFCHNTSIIGGLGVVFESYNLAESMATMNVFDQSVVTGERIEMGTEKQEMSAKDRADIKAMGDRFFKHFADQIKANRPQLSNESDIFDGRVIDGRTALKKGMVDQIGYLKDAIETAEMMAGQEACQTVFFRRRDENPQSIYASSTTPDLMETILPIRVPGVTHRKAPGFYFMWLPESIW